MGGVQFGCGMLPVVLVLAFLGMHLLENVNYFWVIPFLAEGGLGMGVMD